MTYPSTLSELRGRLEAAFLTTSASPGGWDAPRKNQLLNDACRVLQQELDTMGEDAYFKHMENVTPISNEIDLSTLQKECIRPKALAKQQGSGWVTVPIVSATDAMATYSRPQTECWYHIGNVLRTDTETTASYRILYHYRVPPMVADNDPCPLPADTHESVVYQAAYLGSLQSREPEAQKFYLMEYERRRELMFRALRADATTKDRKIRRSDHFGRGPRSRLWEFNFWNSTY